MQNPPASSLFLRRKITHHHRPADENQAPGSVLARLKLAGHFAVRSGRLVDELGVLVLKNEFIDEKTLHPDEDEKEAEGVKKGSDHGREGAAFQRFYNL